MLKDGAGGRKCTCEIKSLSVVLVVVEVGVGAGAGGAQGFPQVYTGANP